MHDKIDLVRELRRTPGWPTLGNAAADEIVCLREQLDEAQKTCFQLKVELSDYTARLEDVESLYKLITERSLQMKIDDEGCDAVFVVLKNVIWEECYND